MFQKSVSPGCTLLITKSPKTSKCPNSELPQHRLSIITSKLIHLVLFFRFTLILSYPIYLSPAICSFPSAVPTKILYVLFISTLLYYMIRHFWELLWTDRSNSIAMNAICEVSHYVTHYFVLLLLPSYAEIGLLASAPCYQTPSYVAYNTKNTRILIL